MNRPGWGWGSGGWGGAGWRGGVWGWGANNWSRAWYNRYVPTAYHGWYHGCWNNSWANLWSVPLAFGATSWGLNSLGSWTSGYYNTAYVNPYYVEPVAAVPVYDYAQPVAVQTYVTSDVDQVAPEVLGDEPPPPTPEQQQAFLLFEQARGAFAGNDNARALDLIEQALRLTPGDPIMHEFRALCLFALGDYGNAAAVLNALLAVAPGWDWTTMSSLYGNASYYTDQLRNLEGYCRQHPDEPASHFVLAYHYLILGHSDSAVRALEVVTAQQPEDVVAAGILQALTGSSAEETPEPSPPPSPADSAPPEEPPAAELVEAPDTDAAISPNEIGADATDEDGPTTDLVGRWRAKPDDQVSFELTIGEDGTFSWIVSPANEAPTTLTGPYGVDGDILILRNEDQGDLVGQAISGGPDRFTFRPIGAPADDPGLTFDRVATDETP